MFVRTLARAFRATPLVRARTLSALGAFLRANKGAFPSDFKARAKAVAKAWGALSKAEKVKFANIGKKTTVRAKSKGRRALSPFAKYVKKNYKSVKGSPAQRLKTLAKKFKAHH